MKKIIILGLMFGAAAFSSCKKYLDIEPKQKLGDNLVVTSLDGLTSTTTGAFNMIQSGNIYGGGIIANTELWADYINTNVISDFSLSQLRSHQFNAYNSQAGGLWGDGYSAILIANTVLKYIPNFQSQNPAQCRLLAGECYFIRAAMHYELVREFAQPSGYTSDDSHLGVPIRLTPATSVTDGQSTPRSTVAQVYAQVISDLVKADSLLPATVDYSSVFVSKYAAEAFLAKAYFSQNKFSEARTYATLAINGPFSLNDSVAAVYSLLGSQVTPETVFQIVDEVNDINTGGLRGAFSVVPFGSTVPEYMLSQSFVALLRQDTAGLQTDSRLAFYRRSFGLYFCKKYDPQYANVNVVRLAELLLTRAECANQAGDDASALADLNKVRARAGLYPSTSTGGGLLTDIRKERALELAMEGDHYFEVKRTKGVFHCQFADYQWNDPTMIYPIPAQEVNENKSMVQNPGY